MFVRIKPVLILMLTLHLLFAKQLIQAEDDKEAPQQPQVVVCQSPIDLTVDSSWLETVVFGNFRIWHIIFSGLGILTVIAVLLCCLFRCRIPRTKQEIEADYTRKKITKLINAHLRKIKLEELEYDPTNLLPVLKRVEDLEENRVKKHRSFELRRLNWRQRIKRLFSKKDISFEDDFGPEDQKGDAQGYKMTKEEMERVEKEVESAKIDSTAFNVITDQISILSYFESDKTRKKRLKEEKKKQKQMEKKKKKKKKEEKKNIKKECKGQIQGKVIEKDKLMELKASNLTKDINKMEERKKSEDKLDAFKLDLESQQDKSIVESVQEIKEETPAPVENRSKEETIKKSSRFSFRSTVMNLMAGFGRKSEPKVEKITPLPDKGPVRDEIVINIGLVARQTRNDHEITKEFENIPQIEVPENEEDDENKKCKKLKQKHKISRMDAVDPNRLQIPEVSVKEINVGRDRKIPILNEIKEKKNQKDTDKSKKSDSIETTSKSMVDSEQSGKLDKKDKVKDQKMSKSKNKDKILKQEKIKEKSKVIKSKDVQKDKKKTKRIKDSEKSTLNNKTKSHPNIIESNLKELEMESAKKSTLKKVIFESFDQKIFGDSSESRIVESSNDKDVKKIKESFPEQVKTKEFSKTFSEHKKSKINRDDKLIKRKTSSSEIEIPVKHVYTEPNLRIIQIHHPQQDVSSSPKPSLITSKLPVEHLETVEKYAAASPNGDRKLIIEKTRNVIFDVVGTSSDDREKQSEKDVKDKSKKKKKIQLLETETNDLGKKDRKDRKSKSRK